MKLALLAEVVVDGRKTGGGCFHFGGGSDFARVNLT
jgi:hypothetical protein